VRKRKGRKEWVMERVADECIVGEGEQW